MPEFTAHTLDTAPQAFRKILPNAEKQLGFIPNLLDREVKYVIQLQLFYSYGSNPPLYPKWQAYLRKHQPPTLIVWGKQDEIFPVEGAHPYKRDLKKVDFHLLDTGLFALEQDGDVIAEHIRRFLGLQKCQ